MRFYKLLFCFFFLATWSTLSFAQTPTDALMMDRGRLCNAILFTDSRWSDYWEGTLKRDNANIGTNINRNVMYMANYGVTDRLNVLVALPYVFTRNTAGHLGGHRGLQDLSLWLKYKAIDRAVGLGQLGIFGTAGASTPVSQYTADLLPMSIGFRCRQVSARAIIDYHMNAGPYITVQGGHTWRSKAQLDRDAFLFEDRIVYASEAPVPNMIDYSAHIGFRKGSWNAAAFYSQGLSLTGDDIRRNDMPQVTNKMNASAAGLMLRYHPQTWGVYASAQRVLTGRNMGLATTVQAGVLYAFKVKKQEPTQ
jgi:hypothetical protein